MADPVPAERRQVQRRPDQWRKQPGTRDATDGGGNDRGKRLGRQQQLGLPAPQPHVARLASVSSRVQAVSSSDSSKTSAPKPAAVTIPCVRAVRAACGTGAVVSVVRAVARNVTDAPGSAR